MLLEQEIEKYLSGQTLCNCDSVSYRNIKNLILGFAEPREKRITELEAQIKKMKCCYNCKHSRTDYVHCITNKHEKWEIKEK